MQNAAWTTVVYFPMICYSDTQLEDLECPPQGHTLRTKFLDRSGGLEVVMVTHRQMVTKDLFLNVKRESRQWKLQHEVFREEFDLVWKENLRAMW